MTVELSAEEARTVRVALAYWRERWAHAPAADAEVQAELARIDHLLAQTESSQGAASRA